MEVRLAAKIIDGNTFAAVIRAECRDRTRRLQQDHGVRSGLAVIMVGETPASAIYVRNKIRACEDVGIRSTSVTFPKDCAPDSLIDKMREFDNDLDVHGILVQLPLPKHMDLDRVIRAIDVNKDVDGFRLYDVGGLVVGNTVFPLCTPYGVLRLPEHENIQTEG
jgi:methylenetetrahydrofolate dehydrogenase (NADP+)/methenyltetrahydrofolate cyclohydrolase